MKLLTKPLLVPFRSLTEYHEAQNLIASSTGGRRYDLPKGRPVKTVPDMVRKLHAQGGGRRTNVLLGGR